ncbi:MAG: hypothetical protein HY701_03105 [Gemmatimonadetes bacterium]|nr:hypothetical protein [Gemmatimonadota bacterium]
MRGIVELLVAGVAGLAALKLAGAFIFPLFGLVFGLVLTILKFVVLGGVAYVVYTMLRRRREHDAIA